MYHLGLVITLLGLGDLVLPQPGNIVGSADTSQNPCASEEQGSNQDSFFYFLGNETCMVCPKPCALCATEVRDLEHPCSSCVSGSVFVPLPEFEPGAITHVEGDGVTEEELGGVEGFDLSAVSGKCVQCADIGQYTRPSSPTISLNITLSQPTFVEGRLQVFYDGHLGAVCDDEWTMGNSIVACNELGYGRAISFTDNYDIIMEGNLTALPIVMDNVRCHGREKSLFNCRFIGPSNHNCEPQETIGIRCMGPHKEEQCASECPVGLFADVNSGFCLPCHDSCMDCSESSLRCIRCWEPNFLAHNGRCQTSCSDGFYGNTERSVCEPCATSCGTCADGLRPDVCLTCQGSTRLYEGVCVSKCPNHTYSLDGPDSSRTCYDTCPVGHFVDENKCAACSSRCVDCTSSSENCSECGSNEFLQPMESDNGVSFRCWKSCKEGYVTDANRVCRKCSDTHCLQCHLGGTFCRKCKTDYELQLGKCVKSCARGLFQNGDVCAHGCPEGHFGNALTWSCEPCLGNCKTCSNATYCTTCYGGFYTKSGSCVRDCGQDHISLGFLPSTDVRLVGGETPLEGRVEIQYAGIWGHVCGHDFTLEAANVICVQLRLGEALQKTNDERFGQSGIVISQTLKCEGSETSVWDCEHDIPSSWHYCADNSMAGVYCSGPDPALTRECRKKNPVTCDQQPCDSRVATCTDLPSEDTAFISASYCGHCPSGYVGDGITCSDVQAVSNRLLFPTRASTTISNWPEGLSLTLPCVVMDPKHLSISWYKDSKPVVSNSQFRVSDEILNIFQPSGERSSGNFTCVVDNGETNTTASFIVTAQEKVKIIEPPNILQKDFQTELTCAHRGFPRPNVEWLKDSVKIITYHGGMTVAENGSLILRGATSDDSGRYSCRVSNEFTSDVADVNLTVRAPPKILNKTPVTIGILGEPFNVRCLASGGPKPVVHWKHMDDDIVPNSHLWTGDNGLLSIDEIVSDDSAQFKCVAVNSIGESDAWVTNLTVMERPTAVIDPLLIEDAPVAIFNCKVGGDPMPNIIWKVSSRGIFSQSNNTAKVYVNRDRISIAELNEADDGTVECIASNPAANTSAEGRIIVYVKPRKLVEPEDLFVVEGSEVELYWPVYGKPSPEISWYKDGNPLDMSHGYQITDTGVEFVAQLPETHGIFRMQANNEKGNTIGEAWVRVVRIYEQFKYSEILNGTVRLEFPEVPTVWLEPNIVFELWVVRDSQINSSSTELGVTQLDTIDVGYEDTMNTSKEFNQTSGYIAVEFDEKLPKEVILGDGKSYQSEFKQETVFNGPLAENEWFALYLKMVSYVRNPDLQIRIIAVTKFLIVYTQNTEYVVKDDGGLSTAAIVLLVIFILLILAALLFCCGYRYRKGKFPLGPVKMIKKNIPNWRDWPQYLCKKGDVEGPIDVRSVLPQFNSTSSPSSIRIKIGSNNPDASTSTLYIPTEDEIERLERLGIHYYDDDNWITRVPKGVLNIHSDKVQAALKRGRRPSLNGHLSLERSSSDPSTSSNKKSPVDSLKTFERTASDPMVAAEELENRLLTQCHVNKAYENTTDDLVNENTKLYSKKGSPVKKSRNRGKTFDDNHSSIDKSISAQSKVSRDSRTDSGFDSGEQWAKKKGLTPQSGSWTSKPKDIVSMMQLEDTLVEPDSSPKFDPATPNRSRRKDRKRRDRAKRTEKSKGIWSRGKKWAKRYVLDKHIDDDALSSTGYSESEFESSANSKYKSISQLAEQRQNTKPSKSRGGPKAWDDIDLESSYIDPSTIVSVPKMTSRMQHLQEHKDDAFERSSGVTTTAFVHRKDRDDEFVNADRTDSSGGKLGRATAIRRGQFPEEVEHSYSDVKISNLESSGYYRQSSYENRSYQDDDYGFDEDYMDDELVEWEDETVTMVDATLPQKSFEKYRQAYLENVPGETTLTPTVTTGIQSLPYDVLSEMYLNEEIAAEKAAEEEKRKAKLQQAIQSSTQEAPSTPPSSAPSSKHTYLSLLNYAEDEEKHCAICGIDHYPICDDPQAEEPAEAPTPPPRPDLTDDIGRDEAPVSTVPSPVKLRREEKPPMKNSSKQSSIKSTSSNPANFPTPVHVSADETSEPPVYVNLDEVNMRPSNTANPPPLPPRQGSLPRNRRTPNSERRTRSMRGTSPHVSKVTEPQSLRAESKVAKGVSPLIKRKIQQLDETKEDEIQQKSAAKDTPVKSNKLNSQQKLVNLGKTDTEATNLKRSGDMMNDRNMAKENVNSLEPAVDIKIQPATPIHKPSRLQISDDSAQVNDSSADSDEKEGSFERIGSVAERRRLFERPVVKGHERASARSFHPEIAKGPDRASTRSMDYQMQGKPGLPLSVHVTSTDFPEQLQDNDQDNKAVEISRGGNHTQIPSKKVPFSKRMAQYENATIQSKNAVGADQSRSEPDPVPVEPVRKVETVSVSPIKTTKQDPMAKETQNDMGWKLHPDKVKIPDIFK